MATPDRGRELALEPLDERTDRRHEVRAEALLEVAAGIAADRGSASGIRRSELDTVHVDTARVVAQPVDGRADPVLEARPGLPAERLAGERSDRPAGPEPRWRRVAGGWRPRSPGPRRRAAGRPRQAARRSTRCGRCRAGSTRPSMPSAVAARTKPSTVSATYVRSRRGSSRPSRISRLPGEELAEHRRQHGSLGLARSERVERPQDHDRQPVAAMEGERQLVGRDLRRRVRRLRLERVGLADRQRLRACRRPRSSTSGSAA